MSFGQASRQANVAFVFKYHDRSRLRDAKIHAADADLGLGKSLSKNAAGRLGQNIHVAGFLDPGLFDK